MAPYKLNVYRFYVGAICADAYATMAEISKQCVRQDE